MTRLELSLLSLGVWLAAAGILLLVAAAFSFNLGLGVLVAAPLCWIAWGLIQGGIVALYWLSPWHMKLRIKATRWRAMWRRPSNRDEFYAWYYAVNLYLITKFLIWLQTSRASPAKG